ncbi:hypothetical protein SAMN05421637_1469 [Demequina mangrovi]|uniref:Uncharacterized protein n=1 Tax=Demequina mangrovi TaxID=1043493 RepID=A0A1H6Y1P8_9MICO|nr:hypothetical protein SAMN05421637_1469 [Demequina mangrovi]
MGRQPEAPERRRGCGTAAEPGLRTTDTHLPLQSENLREATLTYHFGCSGGSADAAGQSSGASGFLTIALAVVTGVPWRRRPSTTTVGGSRLSRWICPS